jgi:glycosyltransferase involved in cell wall biosynthesis
MNTPANPLVSVLIPAYNHAHWITGCVTSVLQQTYANLEVLLLDDCSSDTTFETVKAIADPRLRCSRNTRNQGVSRTLNTLVEMASGEFVAFIGSDDSWNPSKLQKQIQFLTENQSIDFCFTEALTLDAQGNLGPSSPIFDYQNRTRSQWLLRLFFGNCLNAPSVVLRKTVLRKLGCFDPLIRQLQDYDLWVRLLTQGCIFHIINEPLTYYRYSNASLSNNGSLKTFNLDAWETGCVIRNYLSMSVGEFRAIFGSLIEEEKIFIETRGLKVALALVCSKVNRQAYQYVAAQLMTEYFKENLNQIEDSEFHDFIGSLKMFSLPQTQKP